MDQKFSGQRSKPDCGSTCFSLSRATWAKFFKPWTPLTSHVDGEHGGGCREGRGQTDPTQVTERASKDESSCCRQEETSCHRMDRVDRRLGLFTFFYATQACWACSPMETKSLVPSDPALLVDRYTCRTPHFHMYSHSTDHTAQLTVCMAQGA